MPKAKIRAVLDTNILLSAILFGGIPGELLDLWRRGGFELVMSPELLAELVSKLPFKFDFPTDLVAEWQQLFSENTIHILPDYTTKVCRDPDDDKFLDVSLAAKAIYLVTGDQDLLFLKRYQGIRILKPTEFLTILRKEKAEDMKR